MSTGKLTHGLSKHPIYWVWRSIKRRCYNTKCREYKWYGGVGVKMCDEWRTDVQPFYDWCMSNGWAKGLQVDRYPDKSGNYEPQNCRITTSVENNNNRRNNVSIEYNGFTFTAAQWAKLVGGEKNAIANRIKRGYTGYNAIYGVGCGFTVHNGEKIGIKTKLKELTGGVKV